MNKTIGLLAGLRTRVPRRPYIAWGLGLGVAKFLVDTAVVYGFSHRVWSPLGYVVPSIVLRRDAVGAAPEAMHVLLVVLALPFLWIGLSMSVRRAADASVSPWVGVGFLVPILNYLTILYLCLQPTRNVRTWEPAAVGAFRPPTSHDAPPTTVALPSTVTSALLGVLASFVLGLAMLGFSVYGLGVYGQALFFATPFAMGATTAVVYNLRVTRGLGETIGLAIVGTLLAGSTLLLPCYRSSPRARPSWPPPSSTT
jgi:uncharacterized membrane protein YhaH (DUF805 family)